MPNPPDFVPFRVTAVTNGYLPYPNISLTEIWDKSKQDKIAKIVTCLQIAYLSDPAMYWPRPAISCDHDPRAIQTCHYRLLNSHKLVLAVEARRRKTSH